MLNRWAAWPRSTRWLAAIGAVVLGLAIVWALFVPAADWLARYDVGSAKGPLLLAARDDARGRLLTLVAGLAAAGALIFTAQNFALSRRIVELSLRTFEMTEQGQVTERYAKAVEQLGSDKLTVRIGGIYALERVSRDSARDHPTVIEVLAAFIREQSGEQQPPPPDPGSPDRERSTRPDVQAALTVVGRRDATRDIRPVDLTGAFLPGADLTRAFLRGANLTRAILAGADLTGADFGPAGEVPAILKGADLTGATLTWADFTGAYLEEATLAGAHLIRAKFTRAFLTGADLTGVHFDRVNLAGANLDRAILTGAHLIHADLTDAGLVAADLTRAQLPDADLTRANLGPSTPDHANLRETVLNGVSLRDANLRYADLTGAYLISADLTGAYLEEATLTGAYISSAKLAGTRLSRTKFADTQLAGADLTGADLSGADLTGAIWPTKMPVPEGWELGTRSDRLKRAGADSGPTAAS